MASRQPSISGISSRRSACDKCRVSKARCLRGNPDQTRCDRCLRTDSECITSPIFRLRTWQPPTSSDDVANILSSNNETSKRQRRNNQQRRQQEMQQHPTPSESSVSSDVNLLSASETNFPANNFTSYQDLDWHRQSSVPNLPNVFYGDGVHYQMDTTFTHIEGGFDINLAEDFFTRTPPTSSGAEPTASLPSLPSPSADLASGFAAQFNQGYSPGASGNYAPEGYGGVFTDTDQTPMQRLSKLDYELISFLSRLDKEPPNLALKTPFDGEGNSSLPTVVDDVLNRTTEFLLVLKLLNEFYLAPPENSPLDLGNDIRQGSEDTQRSVSPSICSDYDSTTDSPNQLQPLASVKSPHHELDMASLLVVLSVYIHLLRLHLIVVTHLYVCLKELSESENPRLRPILRLSINSTFPIESGNLQTIVLIQTVTSLFERIEALLGLPKEFRISRHRGEERGLLGVPGFLSLAKFILEKENSGIGQHGNGGIKALRKTIAKAKQLLRERIDP